MIARKALQQWASKYLPASTFLHSLGSIILYITIKKETPAKVIFSPENFVPHATLSLALHEFSNLTPCLTRYCQFFGTKSLKDSDVIKKNFPFFHFKALYFIFYLVVYLAQITTLFTL